MTHADFAAALLDADRPPPPGLRSWNGSDPAQRFAVHRNNTLLSLIDALADEHPVLQVLVGEAFFRAMAAVYLRRHPPRNPVLLGLGEHLPSFLADFSPAAGLPWLADVARLEWLRIRAAHAADAVPLRAPDAAVLAALQDPAQAPRLRVGLHPSAAVLVSAHAVVSLWAAHQQDDPAWSIDLDCPEAALVLRPDAEVLVLPLPPATAALAQALLQGRPLGDAAAAALAADAGFDLVHALVLLLQHGAVVHFQRPEECPS
jgi:hypothetical protein